MQKKFGSKLEEKNKNGAKRKDVKINLWK